MGKKNSLDLAIQIATQAHSGQIDKAGQPYVLHPLRVMFQFDSEKERIVAVLHDVIEDSDMSLSEIKCCGFSDEITEALDCLSRKQAESYDDFIDRILTNKLACIIKIEDIKDNLNVTRLNKLQEKDLKRIYKYHQALGRLNNQFQK
ncbi:GTP pyrophosphokinase [Vibrio quintilis]|uniref:GTP pyrophosphokinase n=1 Tax=Vibrio quintilis TaxID=1117707 RepID=A0A1M7Z2Y1_9VIBR|nr:GTP pyrophosphokinase [Vibrio quintilis]SHO59172.1 GTP pyrophosphokinase [Vibrio quintilis]